MRLRVLFDRIGEFIEQKIYEYDGHLSQLKKIDRKYLRFVKEYNQPDSIVDRVFESLKSKDIGQIESSLTIFANNMLANILLIGLSFLIIERENFYRKAGYRSYLEYSMVLFEKLEIAPQTLSDAKNVIAAYIDHYKGLLKHNFKLGHNARKPCYLEEALLNHANTDKVYHQAATATFHEFVDWARLKKEGCFRLLRYN